MIEHLKKHKTIYCSIAQVILIVVDFILYTTLGVLIIFFLQLFGIGTYLLTVQGVDTRTNMFEILFNAHPALELQYLYNAIILSAIYQAVKPLWRRLNILIEEPPLDTKSKKSETVPG